MVSAPAEEFALKADDRVPQALNNYAKFVSNKPGKDNGKPTVAAAKGKNIQ